MEVFLVLLAIITGVALQQIRTLRRSVDELRQRVEALNHRVHTAPFTERAPSADTRPPEVGAPQTQPAPGQPPLAPPGHSPQRPPQQPPAGDLSWAGAPSFPPPAEATGPSAIVRAGRVIIGYFTGGNIVVRVGAIVLFFGVAFLLRYASEQGLVEIPVELRLAGVAALGAALLVIGWRLRRRRRSYALILQGTGVGIVYITAFAALQLFDVLPASVTFALLVGMVSLAAALAVLQNSVSLAGIAVIGGFLAPVLASTGAGSHISLFSYYLVLNVGIAVIAWFRAWRPLNLLGFVFTFVIASIWGGLEYEPGDRPSAQLFLIAFFGLYVAITILFSARQPPRLRGLIDATLVFGVPVVAFVLQASLVSNTEYGLAIAAGVLGLFYALLWLGCRVLGGAAYATLDRAFLALALVFGSLAVPLALDGQWTAAVWALEGVGVLWVAIAQRSRLSMLFALALQFIAGVLYLPVAVFSREGDAAVFNSVFLGGFMLALAGLVSSWLLRQAVLTSDYPTWWRGFSWAMAGWGLGWWLLNGVAEIGIYVDSPYTDIGWLIFIAATALALTLIEVVVDWDEWRLTVVGLLVFLAGFVVLVSVFKENPFGDGYVLGWAAAFGAFYALLWVREHRAPLARWLLAALHTSGWWLLAFLLFAEATYLAGEYAPQVVPQADLLAGPSVLVVMVWVAMSAPGWPLRTLRTTYVAWGSGPLILVLLGWSLLVAPSQGRAPGDLVYLPLLNSLDLVQLVVLVTLVRWWSAVTADGADPALRRYGWWVICAVSFVWLTTVVLRSVSAWADAGYEVEALWRSDVAQASVSILWTTIALTAMVLATRRQWRRVWVAAVSILGVVVVKLFIVDMRGSDTLGTVIAFIAVGVLLLIAGYVSPLPPKRVTPSDEVSHDASTPDQQ
ncbi:DUF2339 domain-containing protein [soil metagenome]